MDKWTYEELQEFIREDIEEFLNDGLNIRQATSRVQVEYAKAIQSSDLEKLIIFMVLCKEGVEHGFLRDDIKEDTLNLLEQINLEQCDRMIDHDERQRLRDDMSRTSALLLYI
ncbi:Imm3 family immunity protein [Vibrio penaeicida]|uniref:Uncharacterized protein n=1 Tax=Vibrio penaeicida TaxID=104609 RepID=A0AAV5NK69_9VIBR|nr:Imm3 family immunity protein [Vibrio penaeicida]GLQ70774.1 hypothetical protein GCM10007932_01340 [Vibrio penaeicida]